MVTVKRGFFLECGGNAAALALSIADILKNGYVQAKAPPLAAHSKSTQQFAKGLRSKARGDKDWALV